MYTHISCTNNKGMMIITSFIHYKDVNVKREN